MRARKGGTVLNDKNPVCRDCVHYYVTWEPGHPHGCRALNFKSQYLPSMEVRRSSGEPCHYFKAKRRG
ncbi:MAG: uracil-DNA glycosylase [Deltaproteobacteria bacterium]|nr:uracil-DNA glycosylase [Deltaproteobacteria bacterium]